MSNRTIAREREWEQRELLRDGLRFDGSGLDGTGGRIPFIKNCDKAGRRAMRHQHDTN